MAMRLFQKHLTGAQQGSVVLFSDFEDGGPMWAEHGPREHRRPVTFDEPFSAPPLVHVSLSMWDIDQQSNQRADLTAEGVSKSGFELVFRTWGDTRVARVRADWLAIGAVHDDDDWDVK